MRRTAAGVVAGLAFSLAMVVSAGSQDSTAVSLRFAEGVTEAIDVEEWDGVPYVSISDVSRVFGGAKYWSPELLRMDILVGKITVRLTLGNPVAMVGSSPVHLPGPVGVRNDVMWVPLDLLTEHLVPLVPDRLQWSPTSREILVGAARANIRRVVTTRKDDHELLEIELTESLVFEVDLEGTRTLVLELRSGVFPDSLPIDDGGRLIDSVRRSHRGNRAVLRLRLSRRVSSVRSSTTTRPPTVLVRLGREPEVPALLGGGTDRTPPSPRRGPIRTVVIDPGHGGSDPGCVGANGLEEKEATLAVARALRSRIKDRLGLRVVLTRGDDEDVPTRRRSQIANEAGGDLFISLHCNGWSDRDAGGFETYFLYAADEGRRSGLDDADEEIRFVPWDRAQIGFLEESSHFAEMVGEELDRGLSIPDRGVRQADLALLSGVAMPAVLIEMAFITNEAEEALLGASKFRGHVATAITRSIEAFVSRSAMLDGSGASEPGSSTTDEYDVAAGFAGRGGAR